MCPVLARGGFCPPFLELWPALPWGHHSVPAALQSVCAPSCTSTSTASALQAARIPPPPLQRLSERKKEKREKKEKKKIRRFSAKKKHCSVLACGFCLLADLGLFSISGAGLHRGGARQLCREGYTPPARALPLPHGQPDPAHQHAREQGVGQRVPPVLGRLTRKQHRNSPDRLGVTAATSRGCINGRGRCVCVRDGAPGVRSTSRGAGARGKRRHAGGDWCYFY